MFYWGLDPSTLLTEINADVLTDAEHSFILYLIARD